MASPTTALTFSGPACEHCLLHVGHLFDCPKYEDFNVFYFKPQRRVVGRMAADWMRNQEVIKNEPMFFRASVEFAREHGRALTREFINRLPSGWENGLIDSRAHMLMPGWYPCIPGWHLDDIPRTRPDGQPDHANPEYTSQHICCILGDASRTEFIDDAVWLDDVPVNGGIIYEKWSRAIDLLKPSTSFITEGDMVQFGWGDFHRGSAATKNGFRWFIRISRNTNLTAKNELRQNANVYMPAIDAGW